VIRLQFLVRIRKSPAKNFMMRYQILRYLRLYLVKTQCSIIKRKRATEMNTATNKINLFAMEYGLILKKVMMDRELTLEAKVIFAYYAFHNYAATEDLPTENVICLELGLSKEQFREHKRLLLEKSYNC